MSGRSSRSWLVLMNLVFMLGCSFAPVKEDQTTPADVREAREDSGATAVEARGRGAIRTSASSLDAPVSPLNTLTPELENASRMYARRIGIVIGVDEYGHGLPVLSSAVSDARGMATALRVLGFDSVYELYDKAAKRSDIMELLRSGLYDEVGPNDLLVVYFAGHGMVGKDGESYLLPQDSTTDIARRGLSMQLLKEAALGLNVRAVLYLVDACLSGAMMRRAGDVRQRIEDEHWREARRNRVVQVISAAGSTEDALERPETGLFTGAVLAGLLEGRADKNGDFVITTEELGSYAKQNVVGDSGDRQHPQWATIEGAGTIFMYDVRRIPEGMRRMMPDIPREKIPGVDLHEVHELMDERRWVDAEAKLRELLLEDACSELYLLLAEVYLEGGAQQRGAFKNQGIVERELAQAETGALTDNQKARLFEIRRRTKKIVRGNY